MPQDSENCNMQDSHYKPTWIQSYAMTSLKESTVVRHCPIAIFI